MVSDWLGGLEVRLAEGGEDELGAALVSLAFVAGERIDVPEDERRPAGRRAALLLAAGGDPARGLDLEGRAVEALAAELDSAERRRALGSGLADLRRPARGRPHVTEVLRELMADPELAWRAYAASILAEEIDL
jgi:hypothetical protein